MQHRGAGSDGTAGTNGTRALRVAQRAVAGYVIAPVIKYLGSKRLLVPAIVEAVRALSPDGTVLDLFSGTARVGHALKGQGYRVIANDHNAYAATLARCYVEADAEDLGVRARSLIEELDALPGAPGYFTETFCVRSRFFMQENGARVDAIRDAIRRMCLEPELEAVLLVSLMEAADRVDSTTGVQMAYLKRWAARASNRLTLRMPDLLPRAKSGKGRALCADAADVASTSADIAYLDPPYNQHKYLGNYHIWETLVRWDEPEVYGIACKRVDCRDRRSAFNSKRGALSALTDVVSRLEARHVIVSFSDEGFVSRAELERVLASRGELIVIAKDYKRYVGAQIGVHSPSGERVGEVSHLRNTEFLYVSTPCAEAAERVRAAFDPAEESAG